LGEHRAREQRAGERDAQGAALPVRERLEEVRTAVERGDQRSEVGAGAASAGRDLGAPRGGAWSVARAGEHLRQCGHPFAPARGRGAPLARVGHAAAKDGARVCERLKEDRALPAAVRHWHTPAQSVLHAEARKYSQNAYGTRIAGLTSSCRGLEIAHAYAASS